MLCLIKKDNVNSKQSVLNMTDISIPVSMVFKKKLNLMYKLNLILFRISIGVQKINFIYGIRNQSLSIIR